MRSELIWRPDDFYRYDLMINSNGFINVMDWRMNGKEL